MRRALVWHLVWLLATACGEAELTPSNGSDEPAGNDSGSTEITSMEVDSNCVPNLGCELERLPSSGDPARDCVDRVNQFRTECACLPALARWSDGEACANEQAEYDSSREPHAGFRADVCNGGFAQNECPGWPSVDGVVGDCLQAMWDEGPPPSGDCEGQCFQDHGHFINMSSEGYSAVACGFFEKGDGDLWAVQNFTR